MANSLYATGANAFLQGAFDALTANVSAGLWSTAYTPNLSTDQYYSAVGGGAIIAGPVQLTSVTGSGGTLSAANTVFASVSGSAAAYVGLFQYTGTSSTSQLIALFDTATGLPVTPNGGSITVAWASGQIFTLNKMLSPRDKKLVQRLADWFNGVLGIPADYSPSGLWLPRPQLIHG